jgi:hypothetical protein
LRPLFVADYKHKLIAAPVHKPVRWSFAALFSGQIAKGPRFRFVAGPIVQPRTQNRTCLLRRSMTTLVISQLISAAK